MADDETDDLENCPGHDDFECPFCKANAPTVDAVQHWNPWRYERTRKCSSCAKSFQTNETLKTGVDDMGCFETEERYVGPS